MKVAIVGYGVEGIASATYWLSKGAEVTICDQRTDISTPEGTTSQLGDQYLSNLDQYDVVVRSAGIHPKLILEASPQVGGKITTSVQEFFEACPSKNVIGVTGTKGKGTTSTLIAKMLEASGKTVHLGGNIGVAPLEMLTSISPDDWVVMELSSFQLEDFRGPSPRITVCLMVVPEHLNWHADMKEYLAAKGRLFANQTVSDVAIYFADNQNSGTIAANSPGTKIPYFKSPGAIVSDGKIVIESQVICNTSEIKLKGRHNWQNVCAAVTAVWQVTQDPEACKQVITTFAGLEHRIQLVRELDGVSYYDDSFATTPETAIAAQEAFDQPKVVILGGSDKGIALDSLADATVNNGIKHAILIGDTAPDLEKLLTSHGFTNFTTGLTSMPEIVASAREHAASGDVILLSTGCASFGLFKDYKDRGNQFIQAVEALD